MQLFRILSLAVLVPATMRAQEPSPHRTHFDFLIGRWAVTEHRDTSGARPSEGERYVFERVVSGGGLGGPWRFNRGTPEQPDFVEARYYSAFDNRTGVWTFYYMSPQSAQFWPARFEEGRWNFYQTFQDDRGTVLQRQWWEPVGDTLLRRHIDNSSDGGRTWVPYVITMRRLRDSEP